MTIPTFVTVGEAAKRTGADPARISRLAKLGHIRAAALDDGGILVAMEDVKHIVVVDRSKFSHMDGIAIHVSEAARKYRFSIGTISRWARAGHIKVLGKDRNRTLLNEADIAYIRAVADAVGLRQGQDLTNYL